MAEFPVVSLGSFRIAKDVGLANGFAIGAEKVQRGGHLIVGSGGIWWMRMIGYSWDDFDRNEERTKQTDAAVEYPSDPDYRVLGDRYLEYIETHFLGTCTTDIELQEAVQKHFPHLHAWDAIDSELHFADAAEKFIWDIFEKDGLKQIEEAQSKGTDYPPLSFFKNYRKQALTMVFEKIWSQGQNFIWESITKWPDIWVMCAKESKEIHSVYALLFDAGRLDASAVLRLQEDIPELFRQKIIDQLERSLQRWSDLYEEESGFWLDLQVGTCCRLVGNMAAIKGQSVVLDQQKTRAT